MNLKELEEVVRVLELRMAALDMEAVTNLSARVDRVVKGFEERLSALDSGSPELAAKVSEMRDHQDGMNDTLAGVVGAMGEVQGELTHIREIVDSRNKSAPTKRNMTDVDAVRVLNGDLVGDQHKEAAEKAGLSYAQVYSCRGEFTFKHVHKELREGGWMNPFKKPEPQHK